MIEGVNEVEVVENDNGGKQSKLQYRFDLIDSKAHFGLAKVLYEGELKHGKDNWKKINVESHLNHATSHIFAYLAGDTTDEHLTHAFARLMMAVGVSGKRKTQEDKNR